MHGNTKGARASTGNTMGLCRDGDDINPVPFGFKLSFLGLALQHTSLPDPQLDSPPALY